MSVFAFTFELVCFCARVRVGVFSRSRVFAFALVCFRVRVGVLRVRVGVFSRSHSRGCVLHFI